jgi:hypothetical protein
MAAAEARAAGYGGIAAVARATGIARSTIAGRFKEGVFGGDKVEVLIQHLLIEADQEGGYERCS